MFTTELKKKIQTYYPGNEGKNVEVEARFGTIAPDGRVTPGVTSEKFYSVLKTFTAIKSMKRSQSKTLNRIQKGPTEITTFDTRGGTRVSYMYKNRIDVTRMEQYGIVYSISEEGFLRNLRREPQFTMERLKERTSFNLADGIRLDLTDVKVSDLINGKQYQNYEIELEITSVNGVNNFESSVKRIWTLLNGTEEVYSYNERKDVTLKFNSILSNKTTLNDFDKQKFSTKLFNSALVQARILRPDDLDVIQEYQNDSNDHVPLENFMTQYSLCHKVDGFRKLLFIDTTGVWLLYPPYQFNLVTRKQIPSLYGHIYDGELVPNEKRTAIAPKSKYFYVPFDTLATSDGTSVQKLPHFANNYNVNEPLQVQGLGSDQDLIVNQDTRMFYAIRLKDYFNGDLIAIHNKIFYPISGPQNFFNTFNALVLAQQDTSISFESSKGSVNGRTKGASTSDIISDNTRTFDGRSAIGTSTTIIIRDDSGISAGTFGASTSDNIGTSGRTKGTSSIEMSINVLPYMTDGMMLTPIDAPYNNGPYKTPLKNRSLLKYPEVCKIKDKVHSTIDFGFDPYTRLLYLDTNEGPKPIDDATFSKYRLKNNIIDKYGLLNDVNKYTVVEFRYEDGWIPEIIRIEKPYPNSIDIGIDIMKNISSGMTFEDLSGTTFFFVRRLHNQVKRKLFEDAIKFVLEDTRSSESENKDEEVSTEFNFGTKSNLTLLDIGSGRGGDISKWRNFKTVLAVEPFHGQDLRKRLSAAYLGDTTVHVLDAYGQDTNAITTAMRSIKDTSLGSVRDASKADVISIMLSLTFFWENEAILNSLVQTIVDNLKPDGKIIFLFMNGDKVSELFNPSTGGPILSTLTLGPATITFSEQLREVNIHIEDTIVQEQKEWLVHIDDLMQRLEPFGFQYIYGRPVDIDGDVFMSRDEKTFNSLFSYAILERDPNIDLPSIQESVDTLAITLDSYTGDPVRIDVVDEEVIVEVPTPKVTIGKVSVRRGDIGENNNRKLPLRSTDLDYAPDLPSSNVLPSLDTLIRQLEDLPVVSAPIYDYRNKTTTFGGTNLKQQTETVSVNGNIVGILPVGETVPDISLKQSPNVIGLSPITSVGRNPITSVGRNSNNFKPATSMLSDDLVQPLNRDLVRISVIDDGSSIFHAILKAFYPSYNTTRDFGTRQGIVDTLRTQLANYLYIPSPIDGSRTVYETVDHGIWVQNAKQGIVMTDSLGTPIPFDIDSIASLIHSNRSVTQDILKYLAEAIQLNIILLGFDSNGNSYHIKTFSSDIDGAPFISVIVDTNGNYELVGLSNQGEKIQTVFAQESDILSKL